MQCYLTHLQKKQYSFYNLLAQFPDVRHFMTREHAVEVHDPVKFLLSALLGPTAITLKAVFPEEV